jgi:hypothetical protein
MPLPVEIAILCFVLSFSLVWDALYREASPPKRTAMALAAIGGLMIAIGGRFPPGVGETGLSPFVTAGAVVVVAGLLVSSLLDLMEIFRKRRLRERSASRGE